MGIVQWFKVGDKGKVENTLNHMKRLHICDLRTGFSWADWHTKEGRKWYKWLMPYLHCHAIILPCFSYTPPSLARSRPGMAPRTSFAPVNLKAYADFLNEIIGRFGNYFEEVEIWNEPNDYCEWDRTIDPKFELFCEMAKMAANWSQQCGKKTVLGGMCPNDPNFLKIMGQCGLFNYIDIIGLHGFPDTAWDVNFRSWEKEINEIKKAIKPFGRKKIWITETGFPTYNDNDEDKQIEKFYQLRKLDLERIYWYELFDMPQDQLSTTHINLGQYDETFYHYGIVQNDGRLKKLYLYWSELNK